MKKTIYTLSVDNYAPDLTAITFPLMRTFAHKIGADFHVIDERRFHDWPAAMEKLQVYDLATERGDDWSIFLDADAMIHPDTFDFTAHLSKDQVMHHALDQSTTRFEPDRFHRRDGRFQSPGNWFAVASDWTRELWDFPRDLTPDQAVARIHPTVNELNNRVDRAHLIDDFIVGRNAAKYGLKTTTFVDLCDRLHIPPIFFFHLYAVTNDVKLAKMKEKLTQWGIG